MDTSQLIWVVHFYLSEVGIQLWWPDFMNKKCFCHLVRQPWWLQCSLVHMEGTLTIFRKMHCYFFALHYVLSSLQFLIIAFLAFNLKKLLNYNRKRVNCTYFKNVLMYVYTHININTVNSTNITLQRNLLHPSV